MSKNFKNEFNEKFVRFGEFYRNYDETRENQGKLLVVPEHIIGFISSIFENLKNDVESKEIPLQDYFSEDLESMAYDSGYNNAIKDIVILIEDILSTQPSQE